MRDSIVRPIQRRVPLPGPRRAVLCAVEVESDLFGTSCALVRNVSTAGAFIEMADPLPLGAQVRVRFGKGAASVMADVVVLQHHAHNFTDAQGPNALAGMVVRFTGFRAEQSAEPFH